MGDDGTPTAGNRRGRSSDSKKTKGGNAGTKRDDAIKERKEKGANDEERKRTRSKTPKKKIQSRSSTPKGDTTPRKKERNTTPGKGTPKLESGGRRIKREQMENKIQQKLQYKQESPATQGSNNMASSQAIVIDGSDDEQTSKGREKESNLSKMGKSPKRKKEDITNSGGKRQSPDTKRAVMDHGRSRGAGRGGGIQGPPEKRTVTRSIQVFDPMVKDTGTERERMEIGMKEKTERRTTSTTEASKGYGKDKENGKEGINVTEKTEAAEKTTHEHDGQETVKGGSEHYGSGVMTTPHTRSMCSQSSRRTCAGRFAVASANSTSCARVC